MGRLQLTTRCVGMLQQYAATAAALMHKVELGHARGYKRRERFTVYTQSKTG